MKIYELIDALYADQTVTVYSVNSHGVIWTGFAKDVPLLTIGSYEIVSVDLAETTYQPLHLTQTNKWNSIYIQAFEKPVCYNREGFIHLCYAIYLDYWVEEHTNDTSSHAEFKDFKINEYTDSDFMQTILSEKLYETYCTFEEMIT